ncbi:hypothetical protein JCM14469_14650 [Desulfatiferula olefinivorans]
MKTILSVLIGGFVLILAWGFWETFHPEVTRVTMPSSALEGVLRGKTLVHLSDLHMARSGYREQKVLAIVKDLSPDLIVLTGDYIPWKGDVAPALSFLSRLDAPLGVFGVMGDYDYSDSRAGCLFCHAPGTGEPTRAHGVRMLKNQRADISVGGNTLALVGLDGSDGDDDLRTFIRKYQGDGPLIVLSHDPLLFDMLGDEGAVLMLAGDTHGGQLYLPARVWRFLGYEKNARYNKGMYRRGDHRLYVSRGLGTSHLPFRLFCRPEITVFIF